MSSLSCCFDERLKIVTPLFDVRQNRTSLFRVSGNACYRLNAVKPRWLPNTGKFTPRNTVNRERFHNGNVKPKPPVAGAGAAGLRIEYGRNYAALCTLPRITYLEEALQAAPRTAALEDDRVLFTSA
jgi:hypothetical protein